MKNKYDIAIVGGGIGGIMSAYRIIQNQPSLNVCIIEKGSDISERVCPIVAGKTNTCVKCKSCAIMEGMAGAGAFSDGKYVISTEYGGWLTDFIDPATVIKYIEEADSIMVSFGATTERYMPNNELKKLCLQHDLHMSQAQLKHLGTDANFETMKRLIESLRDHVDILVNTMVTDVDLNNKVLTLAHNSLEHHIQADRIIFAVGRAGSSFFSKWCKENKIPLDNNQVDIGVRVELPSMVWENFSKKIYEPKIWYRSKGYGDTTRMFCFNEKGAVVTENTGGVLTVNGHSYRDPARKTENSNFALLSTSRFTQPFREPIEYARHVLYWSNVWATWKTDGVRMKNAWHSRQYAQPLTPSLGI